MAGAPPGQTRRKVAPAPIRRRGPVLAPPKLCSLASGERRTQEALRAAAPDLGAALRGLTGRGRGQWTWNHLVPGFWGRYLGPWALSHLKARVPAAYEDAWRTAQFAEVGEILPALPHAAGGRDHADQSGGVKDPSGTRQSPAAS